jgi:hypothetical protein
VLRMLLFVCPQPRSDQRRWGCARTGGGGAQVLLLLLTSKTLLMVLL